MRTGVFVEERVESAVRRTLETVRVRWGPVRRWPGPLRAGSVRERARRRALGSLLAPEGRQERHEGVDAVGAPTLQPLSDGKVAETRKFETHCAATAMATACERIVLGKISEMSTQQMGPHDIMNEAV